MKYIKFTYVDAQTGISVAAEPAQNGPKFPPIVGLQFVWARESAYPTDVPEFFGTCPDDSDTQIDGVLGIFAQADWEQMQDDEMARRPDSPLNKWEAIKALRERRTQEGGYPIADIWAAITASAVAAGKQALVDMADASSKQAVADALKIDSEAAQAEAKTAADALEVENKRLAEALAVQAAADQAAKDKAAFDAAVAAKVAEVTA